MERTFTFEVRDNTLNGAPATDAVSVDAGRAIVDVAFARGFVSAPHFSKCYRDFYGIPPRDERRQRRATEAGDVAVGD